MSAGVVVRLERDDPPELAEQLTRPPSPQARVFVARDRASDWPLGVVHLEQGPDDFAELTDLLVLPNARRVGVARRLVAAAEAYARVQGVVTLRFRMEPGTGSVARALGFTEIDAFGFHVGDETGVYFAKAL